MNVGRLGAALFVLGSAWAASTYVLGYQLVAVGAALVATVGVLVIAATDSSEEPGGFEL